MFVGFVVTASVDESRTYLGPWASRLLAFADTDRALVKAVGLERLPALLHVNLEGKLAGAAEGWRPTEWRAVLANLSRIMSWSRPVLPAAGDPAPFEGSPALAS